MPRVSLVLVAAAAAALLLAGCSSSGPETTTSNSSTSTAPPPPTATGLPFHYQFLGQSSSPSFHVARTGTYTVAYVLKGSDQTPGCTMSIGMVSADGASQQVVSGITLQPTDTKQGSAQVELTASDWHFQEGGGCSWDVTVTVAS